MGEKRRDRGREVPSGTVTFLFTDVEGSTSLWQDHPQAMSAALSRHDEILRSAIEGHGGYVFSTAGDAFAAAFESAPGALTAAVAAQRALSTESWGDAVIRVRMGLHIGEAEERGGDYFGNVVNRTARIMSLAGGGQVVVSSAARETIADRLGVDIELRDLGEQQLKSLSRPEHLYQAIGPGLSDRPVTIAGAVLGNLPTGVAEFVGRTDEIEQLRAKVLPRRIVSLTGIGGAGKTQLSTRVASALADDFPDGVWWCDLTPLSAPELIPSAIAATVGFNIQPGLPPEDAVVEALARRRMLLVMDNCEHVLGGAAAMLRAIVQSCPHVAVIATSREPLGIAEETVWPVRPLDPRTEAVDLLLRRAIAADASIDPSTWNRDDLIELCEHLDGIPLAIEMAAARLRSMSPRQILDRLEDRFRVLRTRRRDGADRHQTLLATLDWSYRLLEPDEQLLLDRLAVFADVFDLEAAEIVCADDGADDLDRFDVADLMGALIGKSLVTMSRTRTRVRYRLLETIRHYGLEHLDGRGEVATMRQRHAQLYRAEAEEAGERFRDHRFWSGRAFFDDNWNELVAAITWAVKGGDRDLAAGLLRACVSYATGFAKSELGALARAALELPEPPAIAYACASFFADGPEQIEIAEAGLRLSSFDKYEQQLLYSQLAAGRATTGAKGTIDAILHATRHAHEDGNPVDAAYWEAIIAEGLVAWKPDDALRHARNARSLLEQCRDHPSASATLGRLAGYEARQGNFDAALELCEEATSMAEAAGILVFRAYTVTLAARVSAALHEDGAAARLRDAIEDARRSGWWLNVWPIMSAAGRWFEATGRLGPAATIDGHFERRGRTRTGYDLLPSEADLSDEHEARRNGARMSADELVDYVIAELADTGEAHA